MFPLQATPAVSEAEWLAGLQEALQAAGCSHCTRRHWPSCAQPRDLPRRSHHHPSPHNIVQRISMDITYNIAMHLIILLLSYNLIKN